MKKLITYLFIIIYLPFEYKNDLITLGNVMPDLSIQNRTINNFHPYNDQTLQVLEYKKVNFFISLTKTF